MRKILSSIGWLVAVSAILGFTLAFLFPSILGGPVPDLYAGLASFLFALEGPVAARHYERTFMPYPAAVASIFLVLAVILWISWFASKARRLVGLLSLSVWVVGGISLGHAGSLVYYYGGFG